MDPSFDSELRNDFLVEAGELVQRLGEQLIGLEAAPRDADLLNAVFRAFHTVKGGAGFLAIEPMVQLCHHAEDLLNVARNGQLLLDANRMDALLEALDLLNDMMAALAGGSAMAMPPRALLQRLMPGPAAAPAAPPPKPVAPPPADGSIDDSEFEALLDSLYGTGGAPGAPAASPTASGSISDDEFEALLDNLHGSGSAPGATTVALPAAVSGAISDDEFESLLDNLHGKGGIPGTNVSVPVAAPVAAPATPAAKHAAPAPENTVRVDTARLDALVHRAGELVLVRNRLLSLAAKTGDETLELAASELDRVADALQNAVLGMRMQPVSRLFQRFPASCATCRVSWARKWNWCRKARAPTSTAVWSKRWLIPWCT